MKRCPQCNSVFDDSLDYCTNDGTPLIAETFVLPSEASPPPDAEEITVIRREPVTHDPITIDIPGAAPPASTEPISYQTATGDTVIPVVIEKPRSTGKYLLFLAVGLVLGGGLVLAAVLFTVYLSQNNDPPPVANTTNQNTASNVKEKPTATPIAASAKHEKRTAETDDEFNGRVITRNAYVRASPNRSAKEIDVLPIDDRLDIEQRENEASPWFRVACEHGTSGWMHGNTIEFTR